MLLIGNLFFFVCLFGILTGALSFLVANTTSKVVTTHPPPKNFGNSSSAVASGGSGAADGDLDNILSDLQDDRLVLFCFCCMFRTLTHVFVAKLLNH
jgi:hypothetical protein